MKHSIASLLMISCLSLSASNNDFKLIIEPCWKDLEQCVYKTKFFGGKWILVGSITFKKKSKESVDLNHLYLHWIGHPMERLVASLYKQQSNCKDCMPLEENLVCDGIWNAKDQLLLFKFNDPQKLGFVNRYYVVLTVPPFLEPIIQQGHFQINPYQLPEQFKQNIDSNNLCLSLKTTDNNTEQATT
ncbi:MAG TPA: hypothetical protein VGT41_03375 [Candidatus Babeliales bacterium]|nr:hypothetical protein [Candidatus Babeliales bacterium]